VIECRECGLQLSERARFCRACGTPVTGEQPATGGPRPDPAGGYWAAVGRAGADRGGGSSAATAVVPPPPVGPAAFVQPPQPPRRPGLIAAAVVAALAVLAAAALIGYQLTREDPIGDDPDPTSTSGPVAGGLGPRVVPDAFDASCRAGESRDGGGNVTTYEPALVMDGNPATAWRCDIPGVRQTLVLRFDRPVRLGSVGLVPGIVKVDRFDGTDRFVQNDRIALVRWRFDDRERTQELEPVRELQRMAVDVTTRTVTLEILRIFPGEDTPAEDGTVRPATGKSPIAEVDLRGPSGG
jgi:hypothetical protein